MIFRFRQFGQGGRKFLVDIIRHITLLQFLYADIRFLLTVCFEPGSPTEDRYIQVNADDGIERNIITEVRCSCSPSAAEIHIQLWVELAKSRFALRLTFHDIHLRTFVIRATLQYILQRKDLHRSGSRVNRVQTVYGIVRLFSHQDIQLLQRQGIVLTRLDILQFRFFQPGGNH